MMSFESVHCYHSFYGKIKIQPQTNRVKFKVRAVLKRHLEPQVAEHSGDFYFIKLQNIMYKN